MPTTHPTPRRHAFTLIELLVVVVIIGIVVSISFPVLRKITEVGQGDAGVTTVSAAVNAARILNHRLERSNLEDIGFPFAGVQLKYHGTAVIFTQGGELRLVETDQLAQDQNDNPLQLPPPDTRVGFKDVEGTDYITLPRRTGIVGVYRDPTPGQGLRFVPPPFAVRFSPDGEQTVAEPFIYYDFDDDGEFDLSSSSHPPADYDPDNHDPRLGNGQGTTGDGRTIYPHEGMPVVKAVILFDANQFRGDWDWDDLDTDIDSDADLRNWFAAHGRAVYFSPLTGVALRGDTQ